MNPRAILFGLTPILATVTAFVVIPYDIECESGYCEATFRVDGPDVCDTLAMRGGTSECDAGHPVASALACAKSAGSIESWECPAVIVDGGPCHAVCTVQIPASTVDLARDTLDTFDAVTDVDERPHGATTFGAKP